MTPSEPSDFDPSIPAAHTPAGVNPSHLFIDDEVILTMGRADWQLTYHKVMVRELLRGHTMCGGHEDDEMDLAAAAGPDLA